MNTDNKTQSNINKKIICLVTGGAGFIGSHLVDELINLGYKVVVLDNLSGGFLRNINSKAIFIKGSVTNQKLVDSLFNKYNFDYVFHLAAYAAEGLSPFIRRFNYENNLIGSINLINASIKHQIKKFIFTSSIAVYGTNQTPMVESLTPQPEDPYGIAKYAIELDLEAAHKMFGLNYVIFRPHNVYGERQNHGDPYRNVLGIFINNIMLHKPLTIFGDGNQTRAFTYVKDVAPYIAQSATNDQATNQIINIGSEKPYTINEIAEIISQYFSKKTEIIHFPPRIEVYQAFSNHLKAKKIFNIKNETKMEVGLKSMIAYAQKIGPIKPKKFKNIEIEENLPPSWAKLT
ncbi:MAG: NAD-dependent epimerase/dehydratase family protein [Candidatus Shapirobacteria bacterium]|nr:NAD-dependent epimerase/dehydratase family protein [Candidatus Shapirobacteria bacterium]MDD4410534.1 NAD-dependent epimerase/dehydratase family protein [Candidatus Shapirobacteria bacterium]